MTFDFKTVVEVGVILANVLLAFSTLRMKAEIAELKVWMYEKFVTKD